jgi:putative colanic acid biosynthesis UDP-glucose lipid carrier transferase
MNSRRVIDIAFGAVGLAIFGAPILAMAAIARHESGKSGFFRQTRYGIHGKPFTIYKIRSLDKKLKPLRISGFFRKSGLDELPQFFNLVKGDMSIVGPRPCSSLPDVPEWMRMLDIHPGLTGLNSVLEKSIGVVNTPSERVRIEKEYVDRRLSQRSSLPLDLLIVFKSAKIVFTGRADAGKFVTPSAPSGSEPTPISELRRLGY